MSLTILVCIEMFNALNSVSESQSMLTVTPLQNVWLILAVLLSVVLHAVILYVPSANPIFYVKPLDLERVIVVLQICAPVCVLDELFKAYDARPKSTRSKADWCRCTTWRACGRKGPVATSPACCADADAAAALGGGASQTG